MRLKDELIRLIFFACALSAIAIMTSLITYLLGIGWPVLQNWILHGFGFVWSFGDEFGIIPLIVSTLYVAFGATVFASVIGLLTGIYLAEYADSRIRSFVKPAIEMLSGVPSIVLGLFGASIITSITYLLTGASISILATWITLGILILPAMASLTEDSMRAVPKEFKEASLALGASKWQTTYKIVLPAAKSGIINSILLTFGRASGEVMVVVFVIGGSIIPRITFDPLATTSTLPIWIVSNVGEGGGGMVFNAVHAIGLVLIAIVGIVNIIIFLISRKRV